MLFSLLKKSGKYFILDVGHQNTKAVVFRTKDATIEKMIMKASPADAFQDGIISSEGSLREFILQCAEELELEEKLEVVTGISGKGVIAKKIDIPEMDSAMIPEFVEIEAEQELFYNKEEMELDYEILQNVNFNKPEAKSLLVITALKKVVANYNRSFEGAGMNCKILDTNFAALFNSFEYNEAPSADSNFMVMDIGCSATNLIITIKNQVVFVRNLPVAGNFFNQRIQQHMGVDHQEAEELKISASRGEESPQELADLITGQINGAFVEEVQSCYELYYSLFPDQSVSRVYLTGGASQTLGLASLLQEKLGFPVQSFDPFKKLHLDSKLRDMKEGLKNFSAVATGLALRSLHD